MTTSLSNIKVTDGTNNMVIKADDITLNGTSVLVDSATWGNIDGTLSDQTDLQTALNNKQDEATAVNYNNITNCITEIPQDIKLELNNGTLTLKTGSKVYIPNGFTGTTPRFNVVNIASDVNLNYTYTPPSDSKVMVFINQNGTVFAYLRNESDCYSGTTQPSGNFTNWYNTDENKMYAIENGAIHGSGFSFPIATIIQGSNGVTKSIDQVFNGFGYIGNTIYMLPGVKGLLANGFNEDGSLKNYTWTNSSIKLRTLTSSQKNHKYITTNLVASIIGTINDQISSDTQPTVPTTSFWYIPKDNLNARVLSNGTANIPYTETAIGRISLDSTGRVLSLTPKTPFHAVDYNDFADLKEEVDNISVATDDTTVSKNTSNQLQAIGTINKNTATGAINPKYDWVGTLAEYNAQSIATSHPTWICYITDDITGGTSVYTKNEMDALLDDKLDADQLQVVSALPASPDPNTFYFVTD